MGDNYNNLKILKSLTSKTSPLNYPDLDICVLGALELFTKKGVQKLKKFDNKRLLVIGSGNALVTGKIIFQDKDAVFANESNYLEKLGVIKNIGEVILISASGEKHAILIAKELKKRKIKFTLFTNNPKSSIKNLINSKNFIVFIKNKEPYSYNVSTYLGYILAKTKENPDKIQYYIKNKVNYVIKNVNFSEYNAFYILIPDKFDKIKEMVTTKFVELFGRRIARDVFTVSQSKHATTIVKSPKELFLSFGYENHTLGKNRLNISLPENADYGSILSIIYYVIGKIQKQNSPWFKKGIKKYCEKSSEFFNFALKPLVE